MTMLKLHPFSFDLRLLRPQFAVPANRDQRGCRSEGSEKNGRSCLGAILTYFLQISQPVYPGCIELDVMFYKIKNVSVYVVVASSKLNGTR